MDGGAEKPVGFEVAPGGRGAEVRERAEPVGRLLQRIEAGKVSPGGAEADVAPLLKAGVPTLALRTVMTHYFDYHHTQADTFDKIAPDDFRKCVGAFAAMSYALADAE